MQFYRSKITNNIITYPYDLDKIFGEGTVDIYVKNGVLEKFNPPPTVIECLKYGSKMVAIHRYREIHGSPLKECKEMVEKIMENMGIKY